MKLSTRIAVAVIGVLFGALSIGLLAGDAPVRTELLILAVAGSVGVVAGAIAARIVASPFVRLTAAVRRAARGDKDVHLEATGNDEIGDLAASFNLLTERIRRHAADVDRSRGEIRGSVARLGEALRATHDLQKLLAVVLETALVAVDGKAGGVFLLTGGRSELTLRVGRQLDASLAESPIALGQGLVGTVADSGRAVLLPGSPDVVLADPEPVEPTALAVPLRSQSQMLGVLALYGRRTIAPFRDEDLEIITSLAQQAGVGIDNVLLHREAQRLSITDGLTGIWNRRFLNMRLTQEFASAKRFGRHLSVLWIDADNFKTVNDEHGHQRGDSTLIELAARLAPGVREVDTLARYGGEEFVLVLPEIDGDGARIVAERILNEVTKEPFGDAGDLPLDLTVSIGCATYPEHGQTQEELLRSADQAMYEAKRRGKNRIVGADEVDGRNGGFAERGTGA